MAVRYGLSINQHLGMVAGIIIAGGGNLDDYSLSQATAVRAKNKVLGNVGEGIKKNSSMLLMKKNIKFNIHY